MGTAEMQVQIQKKDRETGRPADGRCQLKTGDHMEKLREEEHPAVIRQEDQELRQTGRVCGEEEKDNE